MRRIQIIVALLMTANGIAMDQGRLVDEQKVGSRFLPAPRTVRIYLPPSYASSPRRRYPVLYLHDGQNVFSAAGTNCCFGWGSWELDKTVDRLVAGKKMREIIMVALDNSPERYLEYRGPAYPYSEKELQGLRRRPLAPGDNTRFENYARFLAEELKPKIDREYRTYKGADNTAVMGSSLGGICSLALAWDHPKVFGGAASLSGSYQIEKKNFLENVLRCYHRKPKPILVYLDSGMIDFTGDDDGRKDTAAVTAELRRIGWKAEKNLKYFADLRPLNDAELEKAGLRRDKWKEAQKSQHNEFYWRQRVWQALVFLFPAK
jgi:predicted alpha/beta superfamily hydrolase